MENEVLLSIIFQQREELNVDYQGKKYQLVTSQKKKGPWTLCHEIAKKSLFRGVALHLYHRERIYNHQICTLWVFTCPIPKAKVYSALKMNYPENIDRYLTTIMLAMLDRRPWPAGFRACDNCKR